MGPSLPKLSVVLPCYQPAPDWQAQVLAGYQAVVAAAGHRPELLIVDDGNAAPIEQSAGELKAQIPEIRFLRYTPNRGKGYALRQGVAAAAGELLIYTDIDFPYRTESFAALYQQLLAGSADVAIGIKDTTYYESVPPARRFISKSLRRGIGLLLHMPVTDTQCGLKGFNSRGKEQFLATTINRYLFDLEFVARCFKKAIHLKVVALPVTLRPGVTFRKMNYRLLWPEVKNFIALWRKMRS